jgi:hypothetical protein
MSEDRRIAKKDGKIYDIKKVVTSDAWRHKGIVASWELVGWTHIETIEFSSRCDFRLEIYFERLATDNG